MTINFIREVYTAFHDQPENHILVIQENEEGLHFETAPCASLERDEETQRLFKENMKSYFQEEKIPCLTKTAMRQLFLKAANENLEELPFENLEDVQNIFLDHTPLLEQFAIDKAKCSGKGLEGYCETVFLKWHHAFSIREENDPKKTFLMEAELLASRMADREYQKGDQLLLQAGIFYVGKTFVGGGAYITVLHNRDNPSQVKIICRGTALRPTASSGKESGLNDLQLDIGNRGIQTAWPKLKGYLIEKKIEHVELYGKSLGGAHAQRLSVLILREFSSTLHLDSLTTLCSVGVDKETEELFNKAVQKREEDDPLKIRVIRNEGDGIPFLGGNHLGASASSGTKTKVYYLASGDVDIERLDRHKCFFSKLFQTLRSFGNAHIRQATLKDFSFKVISNSKEVVEELRLGNELEKTRTVAAWIFNLFTLGWFNHLSFAAYADPQKEEQRRVEARMWQHDMPVV